MTEPAANFESEVQKVARKRNGDTVNADLFWDIAIALDADSTKRHEETIDLLGAHINDDRDRAAVLARELEEWRDRQANECATRHMELFEEKELPKIIARGPRRASDPKESDYRLLEDEEVGDIRRAWRVGRWFVVAAVLILLDIFGRYLSHTLLGYPS